ncbi:hypothetical protein CDAR_404461 [Caerostris darwini]|uniref:Uncharacterized protein n=1 Tax=Caerostris darwini TaxID=1538125 RepID=A0AAV4STR3_9ARAC|nr:hypothetical protein CDAR_404461 [Caerostris darwini]
MSLHGFQQYCDHLSTSLPSFICGKTGSTWVHHVTSTMMSSADLAGGGGYRGRKMWAYLEGDLASEQTWGFSNVPGECITTNQYGISVRDFLCCSDFYLPEFLTYFIKEIVHKQQHKNRVDRIPKKTPEDDCHLKCFNVRRPNFPNHSAVPSRGA